MFEATLIESRYRPAGDLRNKTIDEIAATPLPVEARFYVVLAENHERTFPGRPYNFARMPKVSSAVTVARSMARKTGEPFHVLAHVGGFHVPAIGTVERLTDRDLDDAGGYSPDVWGWE